MRVFKKLTVLSLIIATASSCFSGTERLTYILSSISKLNTQKNEIIANEDNARRLYDDQKSFQSNRNVADEAPKARKSADSLLTLIENEFEHYYFELLSKKTKIIAYKIEFQGENSSKTKKNQIQLDFEAIKKQYDSLNFLFDLDKKVKLQLKFSEIQSRFFVENLSDWVNDL